MHIDDIATTHNAHSPSPLAQRIRFAVILTAAVLLGEVLGGYFANSLALLSDAGHVFTDLLALALSWFGVLQAERPATARMTYGYHRIGIIIAVANAVTLVLIALVIFYAAYRRFQAPQEVHSTLMLGVAFVGLLANGLVVWRLRHDQQHNLNVRSAFLHAAGDALASVGVVVGGTVIYLTNWYWVDPAVSIFIGIVIAVGAWGIIKESLAVFLEAVPWHIDVEDVAHSIIETGGVKAVHDLHVWSITPQLHALSAHVMVEHDHVIHNALTLQKINQMLQRRFGIDHITIQFECEDCAPDLIDCSCSLAIEETRPPAYRRPRG